MRPFLYSALHAAAAGEVAGKASVIDGDSIMIGEEEIRMPDIDAPEGRQLCKVEGKDWRCGRAAAATLAFLVTGTDIRCLWSERDHYGRVLATCYRGDTDLNAMMVEVGMALAHRRYSSTYVENEARAKAAQRGLWDAEFVPPWEWRESERSRDLDRFSRKCPIPAIG